MSFTKSKILWGSKCVVKIIKYISSLIFTPPKYCFVTATLNNTLSVASSSTDLAVSSFLRLHFAWLARIFLWGGTALASQSWGPCSCCRPHVDNGCFTVQWHLWYLHVPPKGYFRKIKHLGFGIPVRSQRSSVQRASPSCMGRTTGHRICILRADVLKSYRQPSIFTVVQILGGFPGIEQQSSRTNLPHARRIQVTRCSMQDRIRESFVVSWSTSCFSCAFISVLDTLMGQWACGWGGGIPLNPPYLDGHVYLLSVWTLKLEGTHKCRAAVLVSWTRLVSAPLARDCGCDMLMSRLTSADKCPARRFL